MTTVNEQIIKLLKEGIVKEETLAKEHLELAAKYKSSLRELLGDVMLDNVIANSNEEDKHLDDNTGSISRMSFKEIIKSILKEEQSPLTANQLRETYNRKANKSVSKGGFSPSLSEAAKSVITKYVVEGNPIDTKYVYGLPEWFEEEELKEEYLNKIKRTQIGFF